MIANSASAIQQKRARKSCHLWEQEQGKRIETIVPLDV